MEQLESRRLLATLVVNSTADAVDANPGDGLCEISAGGACTLRAAIQEANALANSGGPDQIELPAGTFTLTIPGMDDQQARTGDLDVTEPVIIRGVDSAQTVIDAAGIDRVMDIVRGSAEIQGVTIRGGLIQDDDDPAEGSGGGIRNEGDLTLTDSVVTGNVSAFGAGIANYNGTVQISRSVITGNGDTNTLRGGGLWNYASYDPASMSVTDSTISGNQAGDGGGINNRSYDGVASVSVTRSTISGNTATNGGGISNQSIYYYANNVAANLTMVGSTVSGNTASSSGGGIINQADAGATASTKLTAVTIADNEATSGDGGGIRQVPTAGSDLTLQSSILAGNSAGSTGPDLSSDATSALYSLIQSPDGHAVAGGLTNLVGVDPLLGPLADNGGLTQTHLLQDSSPAIDQGSNPDVVFSDQRGSAFERTVDDPAVDNATDGTDIGAVEVGGTPATLDFGDAPEAIVVDGRLRRYPTRLGSDAARHVVTGDGPHLGTSAPDAESDGQSTATATGDDLVGIDDEDALGSLPIVLTPGQSPSGLTISHDGGASGARLNAWIDFNLDGDWNDAGERILNDLVVPAGLASTSLDGITIPENSVPGTTFIRVRISTQIGLNATGLASDGEVEDVAATIGTPPPKVADLSLVQTVDDDSPELGQDVTFTITVTNDGPDPATNVEVTSLLPLDLIFTSTSFSQGDYDDLDGIWFAGELAAGATAVLTVTATVDSTDPITNDAEITASDQLDPDSTPGNGISGEDDQASVTLGTCLSGGPIHVGANSLTFSCAAPGAFVAFVRGVERGTTTFTQFSTTVDIADAEQIGIAIADSNGNASAMLNLTEDDLDGSILVQAFEIVGGQNKSNTLSLDTQVQMLRAERVGRGGLALQPEVLGPIIDEAISRWDESGMDGEAINRMRSTRVSLSDLPGDALGRVVGGSIILDRDAAGNGWFVDSTPGDDLEFAASGGVSEAVTKIDLLTVVMHEFGHIAGMTDLSNPQHVMHYRLGVGQRRNPETDTNPSQAFDVNADGSVTALDALIIINRLSRFAINREAGASLWVGMSDEPNVYLDANRDFRMTALDALVIINHLGKDRSALGEGEISRVSERFALFQPIAVTAFDSDDFGNANLGRTSIDVPAGRTLLN